MPVVDFTSPVFADSFNTNRKYYVTWTTLGSISQVNLSLSYDGGSNYTNIVANLTNAGSYEWTVPAGYSSQNCRMMLTSSSNSSIFYVSDSFRILSAAGITDIDASKAPVAKVFGARTLSKSMFGMNESLILEVPVFSTAEISVYDASGRLVQKVYDGSLDKGFHEFRITPKDRDGGSLSNGIYFIRVTIEGSNKEKYTKLHKIVKLN